ncbi:hypothetical protein ACQ4M3_04300 [Leptolyngbya sp. AN03gr2]
MNRTASKIPVFGITADLDRPKIHIWMLSSPNTSRVAQQQEYL